jgi:DNA-binding NtrC family response regulator/pSer/pThr/pTyr-binding forkhead associated (FHA) protein
VSSTSSDPQRTRDDDGAWDVAGETCIVVRFGGERRVIEVRDHAEVVIGRSRESTFVADDDRVSRRHLRIVCRDGGLWAGDLGSRNGSTLNGRRITGERSLASGDELSAGPVRVTVCGRRRPDPVGTEGELYERLTAEVERASRFKRPLAVIGLRIDGPTSPVREALHRVAARLRRIDFLGEYAPGELLALLPETTLEQAEPLAISLAETARTVAGVSASARAAGLPETAATADGLIGASLETAKPSAATDEETATVVEDPAMRELFETARRAARSDLTVLITGETGAGKEVVAAEIHRASGRAAGPFVRINCGSLPESLIESELFGHERGSFTGADKRRIGHVERASRGTLLLDEIGELPLGMQAKLLRVIESRRVTRVGATEEIEVDVRFVAATNRDLEREVKRGAFREDLFFRLSPIVLKVPPLRERPRDLPLLAEAFARAAAARGGKRPPRLSADLRRSLERYPWPGNVRELRNVIERAVVLADGDELTPAELPDRMGGTVAAPSGLPMREQVDELERRALERALSECAGNRTHAAKKLGISRRALLYKIKKYGLD